MSHPQQRSSNLAYSYLKEAKRDARRRRDAREGWAEHHARLSRLYASLSLYHRRRAVELRDKEEI